MCPLFIDMYIAVMDSIDSQLPTFDTEIEHEMPIRTRA